MRTNPDPPSFTQPEDVRLFHLEDRLAALTSAPRRTFATARQIGAALAEIQGDLLHQRRGIQSFPTYCAVRLHMHGPLAHVYLQVDALWHDLWPSTRALSIAQLLPLSEMPAPVQPALLDLMAVEQVRSSELLAAAQFAREAEWATDDKSRAGAAHMGLFLARRHRAACLRGERGTGERPEVDELDLDPRWMIDWMADLKRLGLWVAELLKIKQEPLSPVARAHLRSWQLLLEGGGSFIMKALA